MNRKLFLLTSLTLLTSPIYADFGNSRSVAMGGAGVASGEFDAASLHNPALLTRVDETDDFSLTLPALDLEAADKEDVIDTLDDVSDDFDELEAAIDALDNIAANDAKDSVLANLASISDESVTVDVGAGILATVPGQVQGFGLAIKGEAFVDVEVFYDPNDEAIIDAAIASGDSNLDDNNLQSRVNAIGVYITELILSYARVFDINGHNVSFGVSPKFQNIETIQYIETASSQDSDDIDADENINEESAFNLDFGAFYQLDENWSFGASIMNLLGDDYDTVVDPDTGEQATFELKPTLTVGADYKQDWWSLTAELDLLERSSFEGVDGAQFFKVGAELTAKKWAQFRLGYRVNMTDAKEDVATVGLALSPGDAFHIGISGLAGGNTYGAALDLKLTL